MKGKEIRARLRQGERVYSSFIISESPRWAAEAVSKIGLDFVIIDTEHVAQSRSNVAWMCQLYDRFGLNPVVRIPAPDPYLATMVIDGGAKGVVTPYVERAQEVREVAGAIRYRPVRGERLRQRSFEDIPFESTLEEYVTRRNEDLVYIANIESVPAVQALDDILATGLVDAVLIGPHDLTCSLGIPEQYNHPLYLSAVEKIFQKARCHGVGAGVHVVYADGIEHELWLAKAGANLFVHSADLVIYRQKMSQEVGALRAALGDPLEPGSSPSIVI